MDEVSDSNQNVPVGTTLAKIEQGMVVFSAIHARLHAAMGRMLRILHRLNGMYLDDEMEEAEIGSEIASRADFDGPMDVVPVSDPNIFSEAQRFAQVQAVAQRSQMLPQLYDLRKVEERILETLKIPDAESLLLPRQTPTYENAVSENVKASLGRPVVAFPDQDHVAHLKTHLAYMMSPALGMSQLIAPTLLPIMLGHIKEHVVLWYAQEVFDTADDAANFDLNEAMKEIKSKESKQEFDRMLAEASLNVTLRAPEAFASLPPVIAQATQAIQQLTPPPPQDPTVAAAMADIQQRGAAAAAKNQLDMQKLQADQQAGQRKDQLALATEQLRQQHEDRRAGAQIDADLTIHGREMQSEHALALLDLVQNTQQPTEGQPT
jgi:hypothetical protein